jgi:hypothetical protein
MLFQVAILELPTKEDAEAGKLETLVLEPQCVVANKDDYTSAAVLVAMDNAEELKGIDRNRMKVVVSPFESADELKDES